MASVTPLIRVSPVVPECEVIGILNADDWYVHDAIALVVGHLEAADVVFGDIQLWRDEKKEAIVGGSIDLLQWEMTLNHPTVFVKKQCYDAFGTFDPHFRCAMDYDFLLRLKVNNCRFCIRSRSRGEYALGRHE